MLPCADRKRARTGAPAVSGAQPQIWGDRQLQICQAHPQGCAGRWSRHPQVSPTLRCNLHRASNEAGVRGCWCRRILPCCKPHHCAYAAKHVSCSGMHIHNSSATVTTSADASYSNMNMPYSQAQMLAPTARTPKFSWTRHFTQSSSASAACSIAQHSTAM